MTVAYKSGGLRGPLSAYYNKIGNYQRTKVQDFTTTVRKWSNDVDNWSEMGSWLDPKTKVDAWKRQGNLLKAHHNQVMKNRNEAMKEAARSPLLKDAGEFELVRAIQDKNNVLMDELNRVRSRTGMADSEFSLMQNRLNRQMNEQLDGLLNTTKDQQADLLKREGVRHATVGDLRMHMSEAQQKLIETVERQIGKSFNQKIADKDVFINDVGKILDTRGFRRDAEGLLTSLANDFTIPFIKINPIKNVLHR